MAALDELLATQPTAAQIKQYIRDVSEQLSDHMPVVTRFS
jgi:exonuclease III